MILPLILSILFTLSIPFLSNYVSFDLANTV